MNPLVSLFVVSLRKVAENVVTDERTDTHTNESSTITLAAHACRGLMTLFSLQAITSPPSF